MEKTIMRKQIILAAVAAIGALVCSCEREKDINIPAAKNDEVSLVLAGISTRSAEMMMPVQSFNYDLGRADNGEHYVLTETVTEMGPLTDDIAETRGTPVYKENVTDVHGSTFNGEIWSASSRISSDGPFSALAISGGRYTWRRELGYDLWKKAGGPVTFYLHMPSTPAGVSSLTVNNTDKSIAFDYTTPETATEQQDILFASRTIDEATYMEEYKSGGASVLFRHALTGVKFAIGNNDPTEKMQTYITKVVITGLKNSGHAVFVPAGTETNQDDTAEHSSAASFTWTPGTSTGEYTQEFAKSDIQDFVSGDAVNAPESFYKAGQNRNLNKADASLTFWFIPQQITANLKMQVTCFVHDGVKNEDGDEFTLDLEMGKLIIAQTSTTNKEWKAGQLRTFTLKPDVVDVEIHDKVSGFEKTDVEIRNTGNVDAFIRALIVANWWGTAGNETGIAMGYTSEEHTAFVTPWKRTSLTGDNYGGVFERLPGTDWVYASDGYFYYKNAVAPGDATASPLFSKYSMDTEAHPVPRIWYLDGSLKEYTNVFLQMEIPVQAIEAKEGVNWDDAWGAATGTKPVAQ